MGRSIKIVAEIQREWVEEAFAVNGQDLDEDEWRKLSMNPVSLNFGDFTPSQRHRLLMTLTFLALASVK